MTVPEMASVLGVAVVTVEGIGAKARSSCQRDFVAARE